LTIADQEEEGLVGAGVLAGDGVNVVERHGGDSLGEGLKLAQTADPGPQFQAIVSAVEGDMLRRSHFAYYNFCGVHETLRAT
jgi:hypothetical protein